MRGRKILVVLLGMVLILTVAACGNKETEKKSDNKKTEEEQQIEEKEEATDKGVVKKDEVTSTDVKPTTKKETDASKNNTGHNVTSSNKPSQTVSQPAVSHVHNWVEVKTKVEVPETGHYEKVAGWVKFCTVCNVNMDDWTDEEINAHTFGDECPGKFTMDYKNIGEKWVVDTPATTEYRVTGYKCSCGATREKTQYAGMYTKYDKASWDRLEACHQFFKQGLAGDATKKTETFLPYGNWESVIVSNGSTDGAWMWIFIRDWKLDDYSYLQDSVKEGIIDREEAKQVEALYEEIPGIFKGAIERVAPEGGTELYNYVEKLIVQTGGNPDAVPTLSGAKGIISENIPGLYVTIEETRGGFSLMFWAE